MKTNQLYYQDRNRSVMKRQNERFKSYAQFNNYYNSREFSNLDHGMSTHTHTYIYIYIEDLTVYTYKKYFLKL